MKRIIFSIIVSIWLVYVGIMYESKPFIVFSATIMLYMLTCLTILAIQRRKIKVSISNPISITDLGKTLAVHLDIENGTSISIPKIRYEFTICNQFQTKKHKERIRGSLVTKGKNQFLVDFKFDEPGNYEIRLNKVVVYDLFGFYFLKKKLDCCTSLQVMPKLTATNIAISEHTRLFIGDSDYYNDFYPGNDPSEVFKLREYHAGDKIQRIHWKLSAKYDDLIVRENSDPKSAPVTFFLDYSIKDAKHSNGIEAFLGIAFSISFTLLEKECYHFVSWYSGSRQDVVRVHIHDDESFYFMMVAFLADDHRIDSDISLKEFYQNKYRGDRYLYSMYLNQDIKLWKDDELLKTFSNTNWKGQIEEFELVI